MASTKPRSCPKHAIDAGSLSATDRKTINALMAQLPKSQGFPGRHKCQYCAYTLGFDNGHTAALAELEEFINTLKS